MEKEEQIKIQEEWEEEVEEAALLVRKSKPSNNNGVSSNVNINGATDKNNKNSGVIESILSLTENGGGGVIESIVSETESGGGGVIESIVSETESGGGGVIESIVSVTENGDGGAIESIVSETENGGGGVIESIVSETENGGAGGGGNGTVVVVEEKHEHPEEPMEFIASTNGDVEKTQQQNDDVQQTSQNSVFFDKDQGGESISAFSGEELTEKYHVLEGLSATSQNISVKSPSSANGHQYPEHFQDENLPTSTNGHQYPEHFQDENLPTSTNGPSEFSHDTDNASHGSSSIKEIESADVDLIDESDLDVAGIDVEKVLQKQNTHDLYCPNCNSCITRRVILRKRKRRSRIPSDDVKRNKPEARADDKVPANSLQAITDQDHDTSNFPADSGPIPAENDNDREREPDVFRCLSCFSFFIPTGDGFKLFRRFGRKVEKPTTQDEQTSETNRNWFSSIFASQKVKKTEVQGIISDSKADNEENKRGAPSPSPNISNENGQSSSSTKDVVSSGHVSEGLLDIGTSKPRESTVNGKVTTHLEDKSHDMIQFDQDQGRDEGEPKPVGKAPITNGEYATDTGSATNQDGLKLLISSDIGHPILGKTRAEQIFDMDIHKKTKDGIYTNQESKDKVTIAEVKIETRDIFKSNGEVASKITSVKDTVIVVDAGPAETDAIISAAAPLLGAQVSAVEQRGTEAGEKYGIEIIKSIVYGGLVESITSLSVVSSAAGGGAAALSTVALGLANLIGGIFIIGHNLWQLKNDQEDQAINQVTEKVDNYRELLGRRKNFILHAVVAMLSYIIFGLLPPITYGFSFRRSDDRELKLLVVSAASFLCILILATAKAYVQRPPKSYFGTISRYIVLGVMVSGVSYVAGEWFKRVLDELGLFEPSSSSIPSFSFPGNTPNKQAWTSF